jgi:hypothetical protein
MRPPFRPVTRPVILGPIIHRRRAPRFSAPACGGSARAFACGLERRRRAERWTWPAALTLRRIARIQTMVRRTAQTVIAGPWATHLHPTLTRTVVRPIVERLAEREVSTTRLLETVLRSIERTVQSPGRIAHILSVKRADAPASVAAAAPAAQAAGQTAPVTYLRAPPMTLLRTTSVTSPTREAPPASEVRVREPPGRRRDDGRPAPSPTRFELSPGQISRLTDEVVRNIDRRLVSQRERMGGR